MPTDDELIWIIDAARRNELDDSWLDEHGTIHSHSLAGGRFRALFIALDRVTAALAAERALADELASELAAGLIDETGYCTNCGLRTHHVQCPPAQVLARHRAARGQGG